MIRFLIRALIFLVSSAVGILVAAWLITDVHLSLEGVLISIVVLAVLQSVLTPFFLSMATRFAPAFLGGVGLIATLVALIVAVLIPGGLGIASWRGWILAILVVWAVTAFATWLLPLIFLKKKVVTRR
jgi:hypothetical protein